MQRRLRGGLASAGPDLASTLAELGAQQRRARQRQRRQRRAGGGRCRKRRREAVEDAKRRLGSRRSLECVGGGVQAGKPLHGGAESAKVAGVVVGVLPPLETRGDGGEQRRERVKLWPAEGVELHRLVELVQLRQHTLDLVRRAAAVRHSRRGRPTCGATSRRAAAALGWIHLGLRLHGEQPTKRRARGELLVVRRAQQGRPVVAGSGGRRRRARRLARCAEAPAGALQPSTSQSAAQNVLHCCSAPPPLAGGSALCAPAKWQGEATA